MEHHTYYLNEKARGGESSSSKKQKHIVPAHPRAVAGVISVVVHAPRQRPKVGVEAPASGEAVPLVKAQMPFSHHVGRVASFLEALRQRDLVKRQAVRLTGPDDGMLEASVNLIPEGRKVSCY